MTIFNLEEFNVIAHCNKCNKKELCTEVIVTTEDNRQKVECWCKECTDREEKVQFVAESIAHFEEVENTEKLQDEIRKLSDEELQEKYEFADYLWDK